MIINTPTPESKIRMAMRYLKLPEGILKAQKHKAEFRNNEFPKPLITVK